MRAHHVRCLSGTGFYRMAYTEWGPPGAERTIVCAHGLTRNGRDFDDLAGSLAAAGARVVCPDVVGRGRSDWLADPAGYGYPRYMSDMAVLLGRLDRERVDWIGTSMGGLLGMMLAAQANSPIRRLVVNDVGPFIPKAALERIAAYLETRRRFADLAEAEAHYRRVYEPFGDLSDAQWRHLTETSVRPAEGGGLTPLYDPGIAQAFAARPREDVDLWPVWDAIGCPTLVLRGADSDLLLADTAAEMGQRGPRAEVVEIPGCGHAPALMDEGQIDAVGAWLAG